jgi:hypothetical protein
MQQIGYVLLTQRKAQFPQASFQFDTNKEGNSNSGHEFGSELPEMDRRDLLDYLKTL